MQYNLSENVHKITEQFIKDRIPASEEDKLLWQTYRDAYGTGESRLPVFKGTDGAESGYPVLTHYGFAKLSIDETYMNGFYKPQCLELAKSSMSPL